MTLTDNIINFYDSQEFIEFILELQDAVVLNEADPFFTLKQGSDGLGYEATIHDTEKLVMIKLIFAEQFE